MIYWLWLTVALLELCGYLCLTMSILGKKLLRQMLFGTIGLTLILLASYALYENWLLWLLPTLIVPYQLVNLARALVYRTDAKRLQSVSLKSFFWLQSIQILLLVITVAIIRWNLVPFIPLTFISIQAIVATILFGSTLSTWRKIKPVLQRIPMTDSELPSLSVLVPARNESTDLRLCLESLIASDYPKLEIIALDDCSTDKRTPEIIRSFAADGVRFIAGEEPNSRWTAKNFAYQQLRNQASGELLLFCGVDVRVEKQTLRHLVEILYTKNRDMISVLPMRPREEHRKLSFMQAMRYWWELGFPRRYFNRPPVLSTLWLIRSSALDKNGGFAAASRAAIPEAFFAKQLVKYDGYAFLRSTPQLPIFSTKTLDEQYETAVRIRYPQIHHRLSLVALVNFYEAVFLIGPFIFLPFNIFTTQPWAVQMLTVLTVTLLSLTYYLIAIRTHLNNLYLGILTAPVAFLLDVVMLHTSMYKYEFSKVIWHDRTIRTSFLEVIPRLPSLDTKQNKADPTY